jgi:hypothetical protein
LPGPWRRSRLCSSSSLRWWEKPRTRPIIQVPHWSTNSGAHEWDGRVRAWFDERRNKESLILPT